MPALETDTVVLEAEANAAVIAHFNMVQAVIARLNGNSSSCKTWAIAVVGALIGLAGSAKAPAIALFALAPALILSGIDAYYLALERAFRHLFNAKAVRLREGSYRRADLFDLKPASVAGKPFWEAVASPSVASVYGLLLVASVLAYVGLRMTVCS
ncbi:hypothetical protein HT136_13235 [Novosphingobium profundi]|uniref:hypothetical protein n=1 Tax=Novosphingobium profundi TaxID=1774954 RepID=UPI001BD9CAFA|nr:hypothetical protein [Novosphingobium profundi]MBT0669329.1 hypothetical protein [Novosphingobium profundi]